MGLLENNQAVIAYKNLSGLSNTDVAKALGAESEGISLVVGSENVWVSEISPTASVSVSSGVAVKVKAELTLDQTSNGHAYFAKWPTTPPSGTDLKTSSAYSYGAGSLASVSAGDRVRNSIPPSYGPSYTAQLYAAGNTSISFGDARDWLFQYNSGVYFQQDLGGSNPVEIEVYYYTGDNLKNTAGAGATGATGATGSSAYEVWKTNGGVGTEIDFLTSIIGATGATGSDGIMGATGATGSGDKYKTTSITTNDIVMVGSQTYSVFVDDMNLLAYTPNQSLIITDNGDVDNYMYATVTSYSKSTGVLVVSITAGFGTGTGIVDWTININGGSTNIIGAAEDGDYTDGLFNDFIATTPIGTAVDRFNELLLNLVPPSAPALSNWTGNKGGGVNGKLSFDKDYTISGYTNANDTTLSIPSPVAVDGDWNLSGKRLSIYSDSYTQDLTGTLNDQVTTNTASPTAYAAKSFGDANKGNLYLLVNGVTVSNVDLTNLSAQNVLTSGSGLNVTAATSSKFPIGTTFEQFQNRTGDWIVKSNDSNIVKGYNYVIAKHISTSPSFNRILDRFDFIIDDDSTATEILDPTVSHSFSGTKYLSGVKFYTDGVITYGAKIDNLYRNTYYKLNDAITYIDKSPLGNSFETGGSLESTNYVLNTTRQDALVACNGLEEKQVVLANIDFNVNSGVRRFNDPISLNLTAKRTVAKGSRSLATTGGGVTVSNVYLDSYAPSSTNTVEYFADEAKRLKGSNNYDTYGVITSNAWDSEKSLLSSDADHQTGLQIITSKLIYPTHNFSLYGLSSTNPNKDNTAVEYQTCAGSRTYIRYFRQTAPTTAAFKINISGVGVTFVPKSTPLTGSNAWLEIKLPGNTSKVTGWLDCYSDYNPAIGVSNDGDGCKYSTNGSGGLGNDLGLFTGSVGTAVSSGYVLVRITISSTLSQFHYLNQINFTFL